MTIAPVQARGHFSGKSRFNFRQFHDADTALAVQERSGAEVMEGLIADRDIVDRHPVGVAATRAALRNIRGEADGAIREVTIDWSSVPPAAGADDLEIIGPKDGRPIIVNVPAGFPDLIAVSGLVIVVAGSSAGNHMEVRDGATAVVFAETGRKVSITAEPGSTVDFYAAAGARGFQSIRDGATFTAHGDLERVGFSTGSDPWVAQQTRDAQGAADRAAKEEAVFAWMEARTRPRSEADAE